MITRQGFWRPWAVAAPKRVNQAGSVRVTTHRNIQQTWAISRPNSGIAPNTGSPWFIYNQTPGNDGVILRGGTLALTPTKPNVEMDPSDKSTWQREYRFT